MSRAVQLVHKPTAVTAVLWDDSDEARKTLADLGYRRDNGDFRYVDADAPVGTRSLIIPTPEGDRVAVPGEYWIILGVHLHWYCIRNAVKVASYDVAHNELLGLTVTSS